MHYLTSLAEKIVATHNNHHKLLNWPRALTPKGGDSSLVEAIQAVLEQEVEHGRLRYNTLPKHHELISTQAEEMTFFPDLIHFVQAAPGGGSQ
jgi:hypothetical protein